MMPVGDASLLCRDSFLPTTALSCLLTIGWPHVVHGAGVGVGVRDLAIAMSG